MSLRREKQKDSDLPTNLYKVRQKLLSLNDDYWIENGEGEKMFKLNNKALALRQTIVFEDLNGNELCKIQERSLKLKESMEIEDPQGKRLAMVKKASLNIMGQDSWSVNIKGDPDLKVDGKILDHEYTIKQGRNQIAEVSKKWLSFKDSYEVKIESGQDDIVILAVVICIDQMSSD